MADTTTAAPATTETKPAETKPAETKPAETKPAETKPIESALTDETAKETKTDPKETKTEPAKAEIDLKVPEGYEVDDALLGEFKTFAKENGLDSAKAQSLFDLQIKAMDGYASKAEAAWNSQRTQWLESAKKDPEIGGANFKDNIAVARKAIEQFGGPGLKQALNDLGLGNHPEIIRFAYRAGKAISEDSISGVTTSPGTRDEGEANLRKAFPSMYPQA